MIVYITLFLSIKIIEPGAWCHPLNHLRYLIFPNLHLDLLFRRLDPWVFEFPVDPRSRELLFDLSLEFNQFLFDPLIYVPLASYQRAASKGHIIPVGGTALHGSLPYIKVVGVYHFGGRVLDVVDWVAIDRHVDRVVQGACPRTMDTTRRGLDEMWVGEHGLIEKELRGMSTRIDRIVIIFCKIVFFEEYCRFQVLSQHQIGILLRSTLLLWYYIIVSFAVRLRLGIFCTLWTFNLVHL